MKSKWKIALLIALPLVVVGVVVASIKYNQRGIVTVQTGKVARQDLASTVTASGEIKPRNYINLGANLAGPGPISELLVKEGDHVRKGQVVAKIESAQTQADVEMQKATIQSALSDSAAAESGLKAMDDAIVNAQAGLERAKAELERTKLNLDRATELYKQKLIARQDYDQKKAEYDTAVAGINDTQSKVAQTRSQRAQAAQQLASAQSRIAQTQAGFARYNDILQKYNIVAPLDGIVTNLPVRVGETVVPGIQNSRRQHHHDHRRYVAHHRRGQWWTRPISSTCARPAGRLTMDAIANKTFKGHVTEIGDTAILRSTGVAASQSNTSSQEAKDFKVVIAMDNPPDDIRPGLSCTAKITTATRQNVVTIPIQALTVRQKGDLEKKTGESNTVQAAANVDPKAEKVKKEEIQGVFVVNGRQSRVPESGDRHHGRHRYRSAERAESRRPDHHRQLQNHPHHPQSDPREGRQQESRNARGRRHKPEHAMAPQPRS